MSLYYDYPTIDFVQTALNKNTTNGGTISKNGIRTRKKGVRFLIKLTGA